MGEYIGAYPLVIVSPADRDLIADGSSLRRKFIDGSGIPDLIAAPGCGGIARTDNRIAQRPAQNAFRNFAPDRRVRQGDDRTWPQNIRRPAEFPRAVRPCIQKDILGYIRRRGTSGHNIYEHLRKPGCREILHAARARPYGRFFHHRSAQDDLKFTLDGYPVKNYGSQGQQKTFLTALKLAQFHFITSLTGRKPILLLDDIFDKLDSRRVEYIMEPCQRRYFRTDIRFRHTTRTHTRTDARTGRRSQHIHTVEMKKRGP